MGSNISGVGAVLTSAQRAVFTSKTLLCVCSKSISLFNRCIPVDVTCYAEFTQELVTFVSDNNVLRRLIAGVMASKEIIMALCLLALGRDQVSSGLHSLTWKIL